jgi:hypothetical protein
MRLVQNTKINRAYAQGRYARAAYLEEKVRNRLENDGRWSDEVWRLGTLAREEEQEALNNSEPTSPETPDCLS